MTRGEEVATPRKTLRVDTYYYERKSGRYFVTPDGIGCYWYDSYGEMHGQHGFDTRLYFVDELED